LTRWQAARKIIQEPSFARAIRQCDLDLDYLLTFFTDNKTNPLRQIVSDKVLGTDKLSYLLRDGMATGKGGNYTIDTILENTVYERNTLGINERVVDEVLRAINALPDHLCLHLLQHRSTAEPKDIHAARPDRHGVRCAAGQLVRDE